MRLCEFLQHTFRFWADQVSIDIPGRDRVCLLAPNILMDYGNYGKSASYSRGNS